MKTDGKVQVPVSVLEAANHDFAAERISDEVVRDLCIHFIHQGTDFLIRLVVIDTRNHPQIFLTLSRLMSLILTQPLGQLLPALFPPISEHFLPVDRTSLNHALFLFSHQVLLIPTKSYSPRPILRNSQKQCRLHLRQHQILTLIGTCFQPNSADYFRRKRESFKWTGLMLNVFKKSQRKWPFRLPDPRLYRVLWFYFCNNSVTMLLVDILVDTLTWSGIWPFICLLDLLPISTECRIHVLFVRRSCIDQSFSFSMAVKPPQPSCGNPVAFTGGQSPSSVVNYIGAYSTPAQSLHSGRSKQVIVVMVL